MPDINLRAHDIAMLYVSKYAEIDYKASTPIILDQMNEEYENAYNYLCNQLSSDTE